jgi:prepilin-type N-terminal cleavage/methylation domain-containing protein
MHSLKNDKAFTFVEMIIASIIVALLAAVGIPMYRGYVINQKQTTVNNLAETAAAAANAQWRRTNANVTDNDLKPNNTLNLYYNSSKYNIKTSGTNNIIATDQSNSSINSTVSYK